MVLKGLKAKQADIKNAFCQADIDVDVYIDLPKGIHIFDSNPARVDSLRHSQQRRALRLRRALYGLKQSPRLFWRDLRNTLKSAGFKQAVYDPCLFSMKDKETGLFVLILCYVDDLKIIGNLDYGFDLLSATLDARYGKTEISDLSSFLGMNYTRLDDGSLCLDMRAKIAEIIDFIPHSLKGKRQPFNNSSSYGASRRRRLPASAPLVSAPALEATAFRPYH